jgi:hypothetical protein
MAMRWFCLLIVLGLTCNLAARSGRVETLDGRTIAGNVELTNGFLVVTSTNAGSSQVPLADLKIARFENPADARSSYPGGQGNGMLGYYFGNTNLEGSAVVRLDEQIDFDWSIGEPIRGVPIDYFSVCWMAEVEAPASGDFVFSLAADEGGRLHLDEKVIAETRERRDISVASSLPIALEAGKRYPLRFSYYDLSGNARARLYWSGPGLPKSIIPKERLYATSLLAGHAANPGTQQGLLGTYYKEAQFGGSTLTRVDPTIDFNWGDRDPAPGFARTNFSVRWSGQIKADYTEEYTFYTVTDEQVRLWIDNRLLINRPEQSWLMESKEGVALAAGERYDVRLETKSQTGGAVAKLFWSSASISKTNVPSTHLFPSRPAPTGNPGVGAGEKTPAGILLRNGTFVVGTVEKATPTSLRVSGLFKNNPISTVNVGRILCQPLSKSMEARILPGRAGVLLAKGDFVDGDFAGVENGRVKISSILFGIRSYDAAKEVLAVALRDVSAGSAPYEVRLQDSSSLQVRSISFEKDGLLVQDPVLGAARIPVADLSAVQRGGASIGAK